MQWMIDVKYNDRVYLHVMCMIYFLTYLWMEGNYDCVPGAIYFAIYFHSISQVFHPSNISVCSTLYHRPEVNWSLGEILSVIEPIFHCLAKLTTETMKVHKKMDHCGKC